MKSATKSVSRTSSTKSNLNNSLKSASAKSSTHSVKRGMVNAKSASSGFWGSNDFDSILDAD